MRYSTSEAPHKLTYTHQLQQTYISKYYSDMLFICQPNLVAVSLTHVSHMNTNVGR